MNINLYAMLIADVLYRTANGRASDDFRAGQVRGIIYTMAVDLCASAYPPPAVAEAIEAEILKLPYEGLLRVSEEDARRVRRAGRKALREYNDMLQEANDRAMSAIELAGA